MARYDLPAQLDFVLQYTEQEDMFYAGHSMGTTTLMAMHKYRPDLGAKIRLANLLAPVAGEANMGGPLGWIADSWIAGMLDVSCPKLNKTFLISLKSVAYGSDGNWRVSSR